MGNGNRALGDRNHGHLRMVVGLCSGSGSRGSAEQTKSGALRNVPLAWEDAPCPRSGPSPAGIRKLVHDQSPTSFTISNTWECSHGLCNKQPNRHVDPLTEPSSSPRPLIDRPSFNWFQSSVLSHSLGITQKSTPNRQIRCRWSKAQQSPKGKEWGTATPEIRPCI